MMMEDNKEKKHHLPLFGVGPLLIGIIVVLTLGAFLCREMPVFSAGAIDCLSFPLKVVGVVLLLVGIFVWAKGAFFSHMDEGIRENHLVTTGIYAWVRNPMYCGWTIACIGVLSMIGNLIFIVVLPFFFWLIITVFMIHTEEKWLRDLYGKEYDDYCKNVNRIIPWFPKKTNLQ